MCRVLRKSLLAGLYPILLCLNGSALGSSQTEAVCHTSGKKVCVTIEQSDDEKWLWLSTSCYSNCDYYHDTFVDRFLPLEHLADINGFGMNLRKKSEDKLVWSHYKLDRTHKKQAMAFEVEVTKQDRFESFDGKQFSPKLLDDLSRIQPVTAELLNRYYANFTGWVWSSVTHVAAFFTGIISMIALAHTYM
ncbi:hypothetical protein [Endozoicomonas sp. 4G]|uniref:hypothetical protein n=1 Tax=Endozoicomonas sp. 4G TaxID=2872754 RepID=UPI002078B858|nr:hypothetical protein [Endozoicomonas sp. 4G]